MDFVTASTGLISPYWMGLPIRYIHKEYDKEKKLYLKHESNIHETNNISPNHEHCIT